MEKVKGVGTPFPPHYTPEHNEGFMVSHVKRAFDLLITNKQHFILDHVNQGFRTGAPWCVVLKSQGRRKHVFSLDPFCIYRSSPDFNSICYFLLVGSWLFRCCGNNIKDSVERKMRSAVSNTTPHFVSEQRSKRINRINNNSWTLLCSASFDFVRKVSQARNQLGTPGVAMSFLREAQSL